MTPSRPVLTVDLAALAANWRALAARAAPAECAAVVKADAYGIGLAPAARALAAAGARTFFVAQPQEGAALREALGPGPAIYVLDGFTPADAAEFRAFALRPALCSLPQVAAWTAALPGAPAALHIETGINRLALSADELDALRADPPAGLAVDLVMSHLARADEPDSGMNARQRGAFAGRATLIAPLAPGARLSLAATGGILLGAPYHFDLVRAGIGLYGGLPFADALSVVRLDAPLLQVREIAAGETVGYGASWTAPRPSRIGVVPLGYADGFHRATRGARLFLDGRPVPVIGRVSMDLLTLDLTGLPEPAPGTTLEVLGPNQSVDRLAACAGTLGYEVLTGLGRRYLRTYLGDPAT